MACRVRGGVGREDNRQSLTQMYAPHGRRHGRGTAATLVIVKGRMALSSCSSLDRARRPWRRPVPLCGYVGLGSESCPPPHVTVTPDKRTLAPQVVHVVLVGAVLRDAALLLAKSRHRLADSFATEASLSVLPSLFAFDFLFWSLRMISEALR